VLIGAVGAIGGLALLASATSSGVVVLEARLVLAGLDLVVTGALGHARSTPSSATCRRHR
jgi:hypothetical protein